jgi:hypothetical protein
MKTKIGFTRNKKQINSNGNVSIRIGIWKDKIGTLTHKTKKHDFTY